MYFTRESLSRTILWLTCAVSGGVLVAPRPARAAALDWKGYTWNVTTGGMAGVAAGSAANVSVDASGYLHLRIQKNGDTWTAAEIFTTTRLGFGSYQWQVDGPIDVLDKNVVLGLFPYGPAAGIGDDGTNEIDIEYSRWGQADGPNGDWTNYPASGSTIGELSYTFSLAGGTLSTSRFIWTKTSIEDFLLAGLQPPSSTTSLIKSWKYSPANATTNIPQQALPLGMNLWCFDIPSDGKNVEIVVRDFQFVPEGTSAGGSGGGFASAGASSSGAGSGGSAPSNGGSGPTVAGAGSASATPLNGGSGPASAGVGGASAGSGTLAVSSGGMVSSGGTVSNAGPASGESAGCSVRSLPSSPGSSLLCWFPILLSLARRRSRHLRKARD